MAKERDEKGRFTENNSGRPPGAKNRTTAQIKELLNEFVSMNLEDIQEQYNQLEPREKLQFFERVLKYVVPQQQSYTENIDISQLSESELDSLLDRIMKKEGNNEI